jgi:hypothetical protein
VLESKTLVLDFVIEKIFLFFLILVDRRKKIRYSLDRSISTAVVYLYWTEVTFVLVLRMFSKKVPFPPRISLIHAIAFVFASWHPIVSYCACLDIAEPT